MGRSEVTPAPCPDAPSTGRRALLFTGTLLPSFKAGGPIKSVTEILDRAPAAIAISVVTTDRDLGGAHLYLGLLGSYLMRGRNRLFRLNHKRAHHSLEVLRAARRRPPDLLYVNSLRLPIFSLLPIVANAPHLLPADRLLIAPRGELSPRALAIKSRKHRPFLAGWTHLLRTLDPTWHASVEIEAAETRAVLPWARTVALRRSW